MILKTTIRKNEYGEYVIRQHIDGKHIPERDTFEASKNDAIDTALAMEQAARVDNCEVQRGGLFSKII